jgi:hypothetical protein
MIEINIKKEYCIVSKKIVSEEKSIHLFKICFYRKKIFKNGHIPEGFDIRYGKLVRIEPWPVSQIT